MRVGLLGGTGFAASLEGGQPIPVDTPWGEVVVHHRSFADLDLFFVQRHGEKVVPPHRIVHRANVEALVRCRVDAVFAVNAAGALDASIRVPSLLVPDDYVDLRRSSETFFETRAVHVDVAEAYCPTLRSFLVEEAGARDGGTYVAVDGPRLETRAEVRRLRMLGGDVVGMTGCPEAALARERGLCYASLCLVANAAAGVQSAPATALAIKAGAEALAPRAFDAVLRAAARVSAKRACACRDALEGAAL